MGSEDQETNQILALSPDDEAGGHKMRDRILTEFGSPPNFPLLADTGLKVIGRYGLLNPEPYKEWIVPHPAVFVIDQKGRIRWRFSNKNARIRPQNEDILTVLKELGKD